MKINISPYLVTLLLFLALRPGIACAQSNLNDSTRPDLQGLVQFEANRLAYADSSTALLAFFARMDSLMLGHPDTLRILHIGGSHIQADAWSNKVRENLRGLSAFGPASRGLLFPYSLAGTNNPSNYSIQGNRARWKGYRSPVRKDSTLWGLTGITALLTAPCDTLIIDPNLPGNKREPYRFSALRILTDAAPASYTLELLDSMVQVLSDRTDTLAGYRELKFSPELSRARLRIARDTATDTLPLRLMGIDLRNDAPGISYVSIGVNGASFETFERCAWFGKQLRLYPPDLFIISIGTNDAHDSGFDSTLFAQRYGRMIDQAIAARPSCAFILTVPNDSYVRRRHPNRNTRIQQQAIHQMARERGLAVWDFYAIMGGLGSSHKWYHRKLMRPDRVHFTALGYSLKADLFTDAFISAWEKAGDHAPGSIWQRIR